MRAKHSYHSYMIYCPIIVFGTKTNVKIIGIGKRSYTLTYANIWSELSFLFFCWCPTVQVELILDVVICLKT